MLPSKGFRFRISPAAVKAIKTLYADNARKVPGDAPVGFARSGGRILFSPMLVWTDGSMSYAHWPNSRMRCAPAMFGYRARGSLGISTNT
jgi:hypothetical protein